VLTVEVSSTSKSAGGINHSLWRLVGGRQT